MDKVERLRGRGKALARLRRHDLARLNDADRLERILARKPTSQARIASRKDAQALVGKAGPRMHARG